MHIVMKYTPPPPPGNDYYDDDEQADATHSSSSSSMSSITISGIVFREATQTSIAMNDPRGNIYFHDCAWENNSGEATMLIDGRYDESTITTTPTTSSSDVDGGGDEIVGGDEVVGEDAEATDTSDPDNITMVTPSTVGSFADFILTTTTVSSSITTTPMLDADATLSPFDVVDDDDQTMIQSTVKPPKDDDEGSRRELFSLEDVNEVGYNNVMMTMRDQALEESSLLGTRLLGANDAPLSTISINNCLFSVSIILWTRTCVCKISLHVDDISIFTDTAYYYGPIHTSHQIAGQHGKFQHHRLVQVRRIVGRRAGSRFPRNWWKTSPDRSTLHAKVCTLDTRYNQWHFVYEGIHQWFHY